MAKPDNSIVPGIEAFKLVNTGSLQVIARDEEVILPTLRVMLAVDARTMRTPAGESLSWKESRRQKDALIAKAATGITASLGTRSRRRAHIKDSQTVIDGLAFTGEELFAGSHNARLLNSDASVTSLFIGAQHPQVENSVVTGIDVVGSAPGVIPPPEFTSASLQVITDLAETLQDGTSDQIVKQVMKKLSNLHELRTPHDEYGIPEDRRPYRRYGRLAETASIFDNKYFPAINGGGTRLVVVRESVIYASSYALVGVLGGDIYNSAIAAHDRALSHAHVRLHKTHVLNPHGEEYFEEGRRGRPDLAEAAIDAVGQLKAPQPLAAFAAAA